MKRKWTLFTYPAMDIKAAEAMLNRQAEAGRRLERIWFRLAASFVPAEEPVCYCLDWYDPGRGDDSCYRTLLADGGWRKVAQAGYWTVYQAPAGTTPIQTDGALEYRRFQRTALRRMTAGWGVILAMVLLLAVLAPVAARLGLGAVWQYWLGFLARYNTAALALVCLPLLVAGGLLWSGQLLLRLRQWKGAIARGEPFPVPGQGSALAARLLGLAGTLLTAVFLLTLVLDAMAGAFSRPGMAGVLVACLIGVAVKGGRESGQVRKNRVIAALAVCALLALSLLPLSRLTARFRVPLPLGGVSPFPGAELEQREDTASFLASHTEWTEGQLVTLPSGSGTITTARGEGWALAWPWLANWVEAQYRRALGAGLETPEGYEDLWMAPAAGGGDQWLIRRGNTVLWVEDHRLAWQEDRLDYLLALLEQGGNRTGG